MAENHSKSEGKTSKAKHRYKFGYVSIHHEDPKTKIPKFYTKSPSLHLKGDWLIEPGFGT